MSKNQVLHIAGCDKFLPEFVDFIKNNFDFSKHQFILFYGMASSKVESRENIYVAASGKLARIRAYLKLLNSLRSAEKIMLHGLFDPVLMLFLATQPWLLRKCYWIIWGGDLYGQKLERKKWKWKITEFFKRKIIPQLGHFITHIKGDYELAQQWYGATGIWHECFIYPSNLYKEYTLTPRLHDGVNILLGNSAAPTNNHIDALERLRPFVGENIRVYCPLSYGDANYGDQVAATGKAMFGANFIPLREFMPFNKYIELLEEIDIAVFNHNRQQGMGNIITLLGLGKIVYMNSKVSSFRALQQLGIVVNDINDFALLHCRNSSNAAKVSEYFSLTRLKNQWDAIFN